MAEAAAVEEPVDPVAQSGVADDDLTRTERLTCPSHATTVGHGSDGLSPYRQHDTRVAEGGSRILSVSYCFPKCNHSHGRNAK